MISKSNLREKINNIDLVHFYPHFICSIKPLCSIYIGIEVNGYNLMPKICMGHKIILHVTIYIICTQWVDMQVIRLLFSFLIREVRGGF